MASHSKGFSFRARELSQSEYSDYDEEDTKKTPKRNPFDFGDDDVNFDSSGFEFVSTTEVKEFFNVSRGITQVSMYGDDDDDGPLGEPWGGVQYSINNDNSKAEPAKSARFRSTSTVSSSTSSFQAQKDHESFAKTPPARPIPPQSSTNKRTSSISSMTTSKVYSSPKLSTSTTVSAAAVRDNTATSKVESFPMTKSSLKTASSSISDVVANTPQVSTNEYYRLQTEVGQLKRDLQAAKQSRLKPLPVAESVKRIVRGQPYSLELHKSLKDKVELLNSALKMHDGNAIIAVILFLKRTVKKAIFHNELSRHPKALSHYCKFLQEHYDFDELATLYRGLGKYEEAAMVKFKQAIKIQDPSIRLLTLKDILRNDVSNYPISSDLVSTIQDYIKLLEIQINVEISDSRAEIEKHNIVMTTHPRQASLPLLPVITTLYYCCMYHYGEPDNVNSSPLALCNSFKLSDKQFEWIALGACAKIRRWKDIDELLKGKGWFGTSRQRSLIGFDKVVMLLYQNKTPVETVNKYLRLIDDPNKRLSLAISCKCHDVVIETLVAMKDRQKLDQYRGQIPNSVPQQQAITNYLRNTQIKWKN